MARRPGKKYPLIIYRHIVSRWWFAMIFMGLGLFALAYIEYIKPAAEFNALPWQVFAGVGMLAILAGIFFFAIRFMAYVQPHPAFLKFVTPFLRINISYRRIRRTTTTEMRQLFPLKSVSGWGRDVLSPLASKTALVLELNGYPVSPMILRLRVSSLRIRPRISLFLWKIGSNSVRRWKVCAPALNLRMNRASRRIPSFRVCRANEPLIKIKKSPSHVTEIFYAGFLNGCVSDFTGRTMKKDVPAPVADSTQIRP
jgi:hypothetical protein